MTIFKKKKQVEPKTVLTEAPEELESPQEQAYVDGLSDSPEEEVVEEISEEKVEVKKPSPQPNVEIREVPMFMSQSQINNLVIENNIMLKQILATIED